MQPPSLSDFLASLETVPWFSRIGEPIPDLPNLPRIHEWDEWPGPEDEGVAAIGLREQAFYDELIGEDSSLKGTWDQVHGAVFRRATSAVPYDAAKDAWHAPSAAVWQAAWTAGLVGLCLALGRSVPEGIQRRWQWFLRGHWPCGYESVSDGGEPGPLVVF